MKIIKDGDLERLDTTRRFECSKCGCIFDASASEYHKEWDMNNTLLACECPTCHEYVWRSDK